MCLNGVNCGLYVELNRLRGIAWKKMWIPESESMDDLSWRRTQYLRILGLRRKKE